MWYVDNTLLEQLQGLFGAAVERVAPGTAAEITPSTQPQFGHYQCNTAMKLAKVLQQSPRQVAEAIVAELQPSPLVERTALAGPGFINIWLRPQALAGAVETMLGEAQLGVRASHQQRIIMDFSSPNVAKEMHVGHLRSTIIGDCLARVFEFLGNDVVRLNHIGDFGTAFGMLIAYIRENKAGEALTLPKLAAWYKEAKARFDTDEAFKKRAQEAVVAFQGGEPEAEAMWQEICRASRHAYQEVYDLMDVRLIERGESFYKPYLAEAVDALNRKGLITVSDGAKCVFLEGFVGRDGPLPFMVQKADGGYNYAATDLAALTHRIGHEGADRIVVVTDAGQSLHFQMLFATAEKAGILDRTKVRVDHVPFGLVLGADGKKLSSRTGGGERLVDLLTTAVDRALTIMRERNPTWPEAEQQQVAKALGLGAIKYADLSCHRVSDYHFSYDRMLRFEGNTAAFVMYSYVRVLGIQRKVGRESTGEIVLTHPSEIALGLKLLQFRDVLQLVADELLPHKLTEYLFELAEVFNAFFRDCRVEGSPEEAARLRLTEATGRVLRQGLELLGVQVVERM